MPEIIIPKRCSQCKQIKPLTDYSKNRNAKDGHQYQCKICRKVICRVFQQSVKGQIYHREYFRKYSKCEKYLKYLKSEKRRKVRKKYGQSVKCKQMRKKHYKANFIKYQARHSVGHAIRNNKLSRPNTLPCYYCENKAKEYHHHKGYDPENWLDVVPVCIPCHNS